MTPPKTLPHSPYLPFDPTVSQYNTAFGHLLPWEFNGWKRESLSWKEGCYLHAGLNPAGPHRLTGPDALQLLKDACMNGFGRFSIGASKHGVMCNAQGNVMSDGIVWRLGEEEFVSFFLTPYLDFLVDSGRYRVKGENLSGKVFLFQVPDPARWRCWRPPLARACGTSSSCGTGPAEFAGLGAGTGTSTSASTAWAWPARSLTRCTANSKTRRRCTRPC